MERIRMQKRKEITLNEAAEQFILFKTARGVKEVTARNYRQHFYSMSKFTYNIINKLYNWLGK